MTAPALSTIELFRNDMKFSAAHFTIFSATERERLHGHNYYVHASVKAEFLAPGITYDYSITRKAILSLCRQLNEYLLLPQHSPYLKITENAENYLVKFDQDMMTFLKKDTVILPIANVTSEELARWFVETLTADTKALKEKGIHKFKIKISTTAGQFASAVWKRKVPGALATG